MIENVITAAGAHASTYLCNKLNAHKRPDIAFKGIGPWAKWQEYKLYDKPNTEQVKVFNKRTNNFIKFDESLTIEQNFLNYIKKLQLTGKHSVLCGSISLLGNFFLKNDVKVIYLARHPKNAMCSFMTRRHPEVLNNLGVNLNSKEAVEFYANYWNTFVNEHIALNTKIVRFEHSTKDSKDLKNIKTKTILQGIKNNNHNMLNKNMENYLKELVKENYFEIYNKWEI